MASKSIGKIQQSNIAKKRITSQIWMPIESGIFLFLTLLHVSVSTAKCSIYYCY